MTSTKIMPINSFTSRAPVRVNALITKCGVTQAFNPYKRKSPPPIPIEFQALWDTGATASVISSEVVKQLGLKPIGKANVTGVNTTTIVNKYMVNFYLPNNVGVYGVTVLEGKLNNFDILIGMDIITLGDFSISNYNGKTTFSFRIPSIKETDFVKETKSFDKANPHIKIGRNDPCPCGSGKKYKNCHGRT